MLKTFKPLTIACDVDGVVADLHTAWLARYNADFNDRVKVEHITGWALHEFVKGGARYAIYEYLKDPALYEDVLPIPGAREGVAKLREAGHRVVFLTSTVVGQQGAKMKWLAEHGFLTLIHGANSDDYVEAKDKSLIRADALIDDYDKNLENFPGRRILFDAPWNRHVVNYRVARNWGNVVHYLTEAQ